MKMVFENREFTEDGGEVFLSSKHGQFFVKQHREGQVDVQPLTGDPSYRELVGKGIVQTGVITPSQMGQLVKSITTHPCTVILSKIETGDRLFFAYTLCQEG